MERCPPRERSHRCCNTRDRSSFRLGALPAPSHVDPLRVVCRRGWKRERHSHDAAHTNCVAAPPGTHSVVVPYSECACAAVCQHVTVLTGAAPSSQRHDVYEPHKSGATVVNMGSCYSFRRLRGTLSHRRQIVVLSNRYEFAAVIRYLPLTVTALPPPSARRLRCRCLWLCASFGRTLERAWRAEPHYRRS